MINPGSLRHDVNTLPAWEALVDMWSELSRCSRKGASDDLINNIHGSYGLETLPSDTWRFVDSDADQSFTYNRATNEWE